MLPVCFIPSQSTKEKKVVNFKIKLKSHLNSNSRKSSQNPSQNSISSIFTKSTNLILMTQQKLEVWEFLRLQERRNKTAFIPIDLDRFVISRIKNTFEIHEIASKANTEKFSRVNFNIFLWMFGNFMIIFSLLESFFIECWLLLLKNREFLY